MKWVAKRSAALGLLAVALWVGGCKHQPNPPTEQDAIAVWKSIHAKTQSVVPTELVSLEEDQWSEGRKWLVLPLYTLYYRYREIRISVLTILQVGQKLSKATTPSNGRKRAGKGLMARSTLSINCPV